MKVGDKVVAGNHLMDFTSVALTIGKSYEVLEVVEPVYCGQSTLIVVEADNGKKGLFDRARFRKYET